MTILSRRYTGGAIRRSMVSPTLPKIPGRTICHISSCTWCSTVIRGPLNQRGLKNGMPFQISTSASPAAGRLRIPEEITEGKTPYRPLRRSTEYPARCAVGPCPAIPEVRNDTSIPASAQRVAISCAWSSDPPASGSSRSLQAIMWIRRIPAPCAVSARREGPGVTKRSSALSFAVGSCTVVRHLQVIRVNRRSYSGGRGSAGDRPASTTVQRHEGDEDHAEQHRLHDEVIASRHHWPAVGHDDGQCGANRTEDQNP